MNGTGNFGFAFSYSLFRISSSSSVLPRAAALPVAEEAASAVRPKVLHVPTNVVLPLSSPGSL